MELPVVGPGARSTPVVHRVAARAQPVRRDTALVTGDDFIVVPVVAMLSSGAAGVALAPRNNASRALLAAGVSGGASYLLTPLAEHHVVPSLTSSLLRTAVTVLFLLFTAMLFAVLTTFPDGELGSPWVRRTAVVLVVAALVAPVLQLLGSPTLTADGVAEVRNVCALPGMRVFGRLGDVVVGTEPLWVLVGFVGLVLRHRHADSPRRRELRPLLTSLLLLALLLVPIVVDSAGGPKVPEPGFQYVFLFALSLMPVVLLVGISRRTRSLATELLASRLRLTGAEDDVRRRIERDLHDGVQQQLVALLSLTELADRQARNASPRLPETLTDVRAQITGAIEELRELVYGIRPPVLEDSGVAAALESRMRRLPAEVSLDLSRALGVRWSAQTEAAAYFVACEAVTNALKHAPGAPVRVRVAAEQGALLVEVEDEGPGIRAGQELGGGLLGLRDRVESSGGRFSVVPRRGGGTVVRAVFG
jgi:signal transduction histidine kinase